MKVILQNNSRYLPPILIQKCFKKGKTIHVDKQICGNGFSTGFLNIAPGENKINIIIAPNKAVLIEKKRAYNNREFENIRIKFFYQESNETNFNDADVLFFVADSFLLMKDKINEIKHKIDKVLIDEYHSTEIQSLYRYNLIDFESKVKTICNNPNTSIVTVTASPNLYSKVDYIINNGDIKSSIINISKDREGTLKRIKRDIKNGENVIIATNSARSIYKLKNYKNEIEANFIIGESLTRSLVQLAKVVQNTDSNLTIISARGFEGFDIYYKDAKVYYLEDRSNEYETFYIANLYQAINRNRLNTKYIEYNRLELSNSRRNEFINIDSEIEKFVNDKSNSVEHKQTKKYKKYHSFVIFNQDSNGVYSIKKNQVSINLFKEKLLFDKCGFENDFKEFLSSRKVTFNYLNDNNNRLKTQIKRSTKISNLLYNSDLINNLDLFGEKFKIDIRNLHNKAEGKPTPEIRKKYLKVLDSFLMCKNYNGERVTSEREEIAVNLLSNELQFKSLVNDITRAYDVRSIKKYGVKKSESYRNDFKTESYNVVCMLILMYANKRISVPSKWIANRNYNLLTQIGVDEIKLIGDRFNVDVMEIDIKNCFPRVLYAINGLKLPPNFYGENKKNKLAINVYLNDFFYDKSKLTPFKIQKIRAIEKFKSYGFDSIVITYLMDNFFESKFKGDLFNKLSFYEKKIISNIKDYSKNWSNEGVTRRHDSVLIFNNGSELTRLNNYKFMNIGGWFDIEEHNVIKLHSEDQSNDDFFKEMEEFESLRYMSI